MSSRCTASSRRKPETEESEEHSSVTTTGVRDTCRDPSLTALRRRVRW